MSDLRRTAIHRALYRPNLFLGGEREPVMLTAVICAGLPVSSLNLVAAAIGLGLWIALTGIFRMMAKADPYMTRVYLRHLRYAGYYPARARVSRPD
jgi:type IV secretion system protein VirB3